MITRLFSKFFGCRRGKKHSVLVFFKGFQKKCLQNLLLQAKQTSLNTGEKVTIHCITWVSFVLLSALMPWRGFDISFVISWSDSLHFTCSSNVNSKENMKYGPDMAKWQHTASKTDVVKLRSLSRPVVVYFIHHQDKRHLPEHSLSQCSSRGAAKVKALASLPK